MSKSASGPGAEPRPGPPRTNPASRPSHWPASRASAAARLGTVHDWEPERTRAPLRWMWPGSTPPAVPSVPHARLWRRQKAGSAVEHPGWHREGSRAEGNVDAATAQACSPGRRRSKQGTRDSPASCSLTELRRRPRESRAFVAKPGRIKALEGSAALLMPPSTPAVGQVTPLQRVWTDDRSSPVRVLNRHQIFAHEGG